MPIHPEDLELGKNDRFCVQTVVEIEDGTTDVDGMLDGQWRRRHQLLEPLRKMRDPSGWLLTRDPAL